MLGWRASHRALRAVLVAAVVIAGFIVVPAVAPGLLHSARADDPVSGAFALGGGLAGSVDARTGQFSVSMPLVDVAGRGASGISMSLSWDQSRAAAGVDPTGLGNGWSLGTTFVDTAGDATVYPANGGSYAADDSYASGLRYYLLDDMVFNEGGGTLPGRSVPGGTAIPAQAYGFTIAYDDGRTDYFDLNGNLIARTDRFGNRSDLSYSDAGAGAWQPNTVVDAYGLVTTFDYNSDPGSILVKAPKRSDGVVPTTTVTFNSNNDIQTITDPVGNTTTFGYTDLPVAGSTQHLVETATGPAGATSTIGYDVVAYPSAPPLVIAQTLDVADGNGNPLSPTRTFDIDPPQNSESHDYAGYPQYLSTGGTDQLYEQADPNYTYTTMISTPTAATISTYDASHRLVERVVQGTDHDGNYVTANDQVAAYPDVAPPNSQQPNYSRPTSTTITYSAKSGPNGFTAVSGKGRSVTTTTKYDGHGRLLTSVDEVGTSTTNAYDPKYGLLTSSVVTGADGTSSSTTNALSDDAKTVKTSTTAQGVTAAKATARTVTTYTFDQFGEPATRTVAWAPKAAPPKDAGPATATTKYSTVIDAAAATRTLTVTKALGTSAESATKTTIDLVSGKTVAFADELGRITSRGYDAAGRATSVTPPTGLTSTTAYNLATSSAPATTLQTTSDGRQVLTTYDPLGRVVKVTDNVQKGLFVKDPTTRTVSTHAYTANAVSGSSGAPGTTLTSTDLAGRTTTTVSDGLGNTVLETAANGVTRATGYDNVANTVTRQTIADNGSGPSQIIKTGYDALNRAVSSRTTYPTGARSPVTGLPILLADPATQTNLDGIGRQTSVTDSDLVTTPDYAGAGGVPVTTTVAPTKTAPAPGPVVTATDATMIDGRATERTLDQSGATGRSGTALSYDAAGRVATATDPLGRATTFTYYDDGQQHTRTSPSGTVTTTTYDSAGRLQTSSAKASDGTTTTTTTTYVPAGKPGAGRVASVSDASGTIGYGYDADGNRTTVSYPDGSTTKNSYRDDGLLDTSTDATGAVTQYEYNTDTSLLSATQTRNGATLASVTYTYDGLGRLKTTTRGNKLVTTNVYTPNNLLASQTTVDGTGAQVEVHSYAYDTHHNLTLKTDITPRPSRCSLSCSPGPSTFGTWTTSYSYDAYDRLTGSAVYSGAKAVGTAATSTSYALDVSGNVTSTTRTTRSTGFRPTTTKQVIVDAVDAAGELTKRTTGSTSVAQVFDNDGRVTTALNGATTTYRPDGLPATVSHAGVTTTFAYWADGTRRRSSTVDPADGTTDIELHYSPAGTLINDTTTTTGLGAQSGSATASYLVTTGRESRSLQPGTTPAGAVNGAAAAPVTTGAGVGYYLRDRHSSVTALVDGNGAVTNTYAYGDYGAPALLSGRPGTVVGALPGTTAGTSNPLQYVGAALRAMYTDTALGTLMTPSRFYDPSQGRFTGRDTANVHNRYVGFDTNPIMNVDPSGQSPLADFFIDAIYVVVFAIAAVVTGGAAAEVGAAVFGAAEAAEATTGAVVASTEAAAEGSAGAAGAAAAGAHAAATTTAVTVGSFAAQAVATTANLVGLAANATRFADDIDNATSGKHFLTDDQRSDISNVATVAGSVAGVSGMFAAGAETATDAAEGAADAATTSPDAEPSGPPKQVEESDPEDSAPAAGAAGSSLNLDDLFNESPAQDATQKQRIDTHWTNVDNNPGAQAPASSRSVLSRVADRLTGRAARQAEQARTAAEVSYQQFLVDERARIRGLSFAASNKVGAAAILGQDVSRVPLDDEQSEGVPDWFWGEGGGGG